MDVNLCACGERQSKQSFFVVRIAPKLQLVDKSDPIILKPLDFDIGHAGVTPNGANVPLVQIVDGHRNKSLLFQRRDVAGEAAWVQAKEFGKITVASKTATLIVERMNFYE